MNDSVASAHCVAAQVECERQTLKPGYHLIGNHLKPGVFKLMGQLDSTCTAPPLRLERVQLPHAHRVLRGVAVQVAF
jgi:hypothetical protein